ncbi:MAG TPA: GDSL-type esterase/lipase family protein [Myxococcales bacterium]|nr:GDSL-type esterase/lipase family protein [Myxococcales bacterium]
MYSNDARIRRRKLLWGASLLLAGLAVASAPVLAHGDDHRGQKWVASWAASAHGPYPSGNAVAQPNLAFAFGDPAVGANDQTFRLVVRPDLWGKTFRLRFSNRWGVQPVTLDDVYVGLQKSAGALVPDSNRPVTFHRRGTLTIPAGQVAYSDPVELEYVSDPAKFYLDGKKMAVSFHVVGTSGLMTWHAKALQTSYVSKPGTGSHGGDEGDDAFPNSTTSWYFLDVVEVMAPSDTLLVVAFGDSITDGTASTLNGDDRWPDDLSRRLHAKYGDRVSLVDEGIGGNRILTPLDADYTPQTPFSGGPRALSRIELDVFSLGGVSAVVWLEGINDLSAGATSDEVIAGIRQGAQLMHARGLKLIQATITSALGNNTADPAADVDRDNRRKAVNAFIRTAGIFESMADMDAATVDPATGSLKAEFLVNSTLGTIDHLHPNRAGYQAMARTVDIRVLGPDGHGHRDHDD